VIDKISLVDVLATFIFWAIYVEYRMQHNMLGTNIWQHGDTYWTIPHHMTSHHYDSVSSSWGGVDGDYN